MFGFWGFIKHNMYDVGYRLVFCNKEIPKYSNWTRFKKNTSLEYKSKQAAVQYYYGWMQPDDIGI